MADLGKVVYLSEAQKETLFTQGSITVGGTTITYSDNDLYVTPSAIDLAPVAQSNNLVTSGGVYAALDAKAAGPSSSVNNHVVVFDGATGKVLKDSGFTIEKSVPSNAVFTDNNTTYTFAEGTTDGAFNVTPLGGSAQSVSVHNVLKTGDIASWAKAATKPTYTKSEVGLGNVDNTSDANKPISTATQAALDGKVSTSDYAPVTKTADMTQQVGKGGNGQLWTSPELPAVTASDNGKVLRVVSGAWAAAELPLYNGGVTYEP